MDLHPEEPSFEPFHRVRDPALLDLVGTPRLVLVDGRSGGGKTTFATRLADLLGSALVHTDDVARDFSRFGWADRLVETVLRPRAGEALVVEGVGAGRASLAPYADLVVWVQSDRTEARTRGIERDASYGTRTPDEAVAFWDDWMTEEEPYLAADRPWERAGLVVLGTPQGAGRTSGKDPALDESTTWVSVPRSAATLRSPTSEAQSDSSSA